MSTSFEILERNMSAIRLRNRELYDRLEAAVLPPEEEILKNLSLINNADVWLQSGRDTIARLNITYAKVAVFLGFGSGAEFAAYVSEKVAKCATEHLVIIEKSLKSLKYAFCIADFSSVIKSKSIHFFVEETPDSLFSELIELFGSTGMYVFANAISVIFSEASLLGNAEYYFEVRKQFQNALEYKLHQYACSAEDSIVGIENMLSNLDTIIENPGINLLKGAFENIPAVVVASGPSLDGNKHILKNIRTDSGDRALIIAADSALKPLYEIGVIPHIVVALERGVALKKVFSGLPQEAFSDTYLAACPVVDHEFFDAFNGKKIIVYRNLDHFRWLGIERGILDIQATAGNMAFAVAQYLGCKDILIVGQDFCQSEDGKDHTCGFALANNGVSEHGRKDFDNNAVFVKGTYRDVVKSSTTWLPGIRAYEHQIVQSKINCINCSDGAYIRGTTAMPLEQALDKFAFRMHDIFEKIAVNLSVFKKDGGAKNRVLTLIQESIIDIEKIKSACFEALQEIDKMEKGWSENVAAGKTRYMRLSSLTNKIRAPYQVFNSTHRTYQLLMMHALQSFVLPFRVMLYGVPVSEPKRNIAEYKMNMMHREMYKRVIHYCEIFRDLLERSRVALRSGVYERSEISKRFNKL